MKNSLLKDSTFRKRSLLESVRSYLDQEGKNVSILPVRPQTPNIVLDSPPRAAAAAGTTNLSTSSGFGKKFRNLLQSQPEEKEEKEGNSLLRKRKSRPPSADPPLALESNRITSGSQGKRTRLSFDPSPPRERLPPSSRQSTIQPPKHSRIVESSAVAQPTTSIGFTSSNWRNRMQTIIARGAPSHSTSPTPTPSEPLGNLVSASSMEIVSEVVRTPTHPTTPTPTPSSKRNVVPSKSEVSLNFVRKDLKSRGSYKFKSGKNARRAKSRDFRQGRERSSFNSDIGRIDNQDDTGAPPREKRSSGLSVFGLDPFHLFLESSTGRKSEGADSEISPPLCPGHQMAAKLLTVKKAGLNKGKKFYVCSYPFDQRCNFFLWEQDNPNIFLSSSSKTNIVHKSYLQSTVLLFRNRLLDFDLFELRAQVARVNHILKENRCERRLSTSGKKEDMVTSLISAITALFSPEGPILENPESEDFREICSIGSSQGDINITPDASSPESPLIELSDDDDNNDDKCSRSDDFQASNDLQPKDLVLQALQRSFALTSLKTGQKWAIDRVLSNQKSLLILPTGAGKSLTFLLPSLISCPRDGVTIVISPLVALMRDQMRKLPFNLPAACLSGEVTATEAAKICADLVAGFLRIIFISPERLCSPSFLRLIKSLRKSTRSPCQTLSNDLSTELTGPGVGLLCVDEAHCVSQWSFNFRPSFLRIKKEIQRIQPKSVLALTATAPIHVQKDIQRSLGIPDDGIFFIPPHRPNLELESQFIQGEEEKRQMILEALKKNSESTKRQCPTIVYVWRRDEADTLSQYLQLEGIAAKGYHAGMSSSQRMRIQHLFYRGTLDVVVATIAFGMGIDKSNIRLVIHHSMPKDIESYLQEIGRAGRDGIRSRCLLLLSTEDFLKHHSFAYSPTLATAQIYLLLKRIFLPFPTGKFMLQETVALDLDGSADDLDISASMIETIVSYLEEHESVSLVVEESRYDRITGKLKVLPASEQSTPLIQAIATLNTIAPSPQTQSDFEVSLLTLSSHLRLTPEETSAQLFDQQNRGILVYKFSRKCLYLTISKQPSLFALDNLETWLWKLASSLTTILKSKLQTAAERVQNVWRFGKILDGGSHAKERGEQFLHDYMTDGKLNPPTPEEAEYPDGFIHNPTLHSSNISDEDPFELHKCKRQIDILLLDPSIHDILQRFHFIGSEEMKSELRAVAIAKILHGVQSSHIRVADWEHRAQWNSSRMISFPTILSLCQTYRSSVDSDLID